MRGIATYIFAGAAVWAGAVGPVAAEDLPSFQPQCLIANLDNLPHAICEFGPLAGGRIVHVQASKEGVGAAQEANFLGFTTVGKSSAVYYLVDRSTRRVKTLTPSIADAARLLEAARLSGPNDRFGFGAFSDRLDTIAQIGATREETVRATGVVRPEGQSSELYRFGVDAAKLLGLAQAERRILVIASDGRSDDTSATAADLVAAAKEAKAVVVALGYREKQDQPELAAFRKLAEDTGGTYWETNPQTGRFDEETVTRFSQYLDSGGTATFPLDKSSPRGRYLLTVQFEGGRSATGIVQADVIPPPGADAGKAEAGTGPVPSGGPAAPATGGFWEKERVLLAGVLVLALIGAGAGVWYALRARHPEKALAFLDTLDGARRPIVSAATRIGRHSDNDIRFVNDSVHRHHAVITREPDGRFSIADITRNRQTSNGVIVNGAFVEKQRLADGDLVELGEVKFRFVYA
ncbi:FHA domain-containing protein [Methyloraptor flagellatus]|uniref:FHA domain-containing protein n=1 Tax=Methyloraptor flagellatus TaxID=3162530 RepID=A0AAU7XF56_9HYPH